ncbi:MAG: hypothetical protein ACI9F9_002956 [Candidatus Paceibacteria bacterium]
MPDVFDIASGLEQDCNGDLVPDSCFVTTDCNTNGVDDLIDVECGVSDDLNGNGVLDECESGLTLYVNGGAAPGGDGSIGAPFNNWGAAFALALDGWSIEVASGTYTGTQNRNLNFAGRSLNIYSASGSGNCILDLEQNGRAFTSLAGSPDINISGLTIMNGRGTAGGPGGLWVGSGTDITVEDCVIQNCSAMAAAGAIRCDGDIELIDCVLAGNTAIAEAGSSFGGAMHVFGSVRASGTSFLGNSAITGGAVFYQGSSFSNAFAHCRFEDNLSEQRGGAIAQFKGRMMVDNCLFTGNWATAGAGGGIWNGSTLGGASTKLFVTSSTFADNHAGPGASAFEGGGAFFVASSGDLEVRNTILWGNTAGAGPAIKAFTQNSWQPTLDIRFCDLEGGVSALDLTNTVFSSGPLLDLDPLFNNPGLGDYVLAPGSPCVDAGRDSDLANDTLDIDRDGNTSERVPLDLGGLLREVDDPGAPDVGVGSGPITDMGAYERQAP